MLKNQIICRNSQVKSRLKFVCLKESRILSAQKTAVVPRLATLSIDVG